MGYDTHYDAIFKVRPTINADDLRETLALDPDPWFVTDETIEGPEEETGWQ